MKQIILIFVVSVTALFASTNEVRKIEKFTKLFVTGKPFSVELKKGTENKIELTLDGITEDKIITSVVNGELKISAKGLFNNGSAKCVIYYTEEIAWIEAGNTAVIKCSETMQQKSIDLVSRGDGYFNITLDCENVKILCEAGGDGKVKGKTKNININTSGSSQLKAEELEAETAVVVTTLKGEVHVKVLNSLTSTTSLGATVTVHQPYPPTIIEKNDTGGSLIRKQ